MPTYRAKYVCRMCMGVQYDHPRLTSNDATIYAVISIGIQGKYVAPLAGEKVLFAKHLAHHCPTGSIGLSDFQGFERVEEDNG